ncbi:hypothetical protein ABIA27_004135 [Sinorhizobium fredii]
MSADFEVCEARLPLSSGLTRGLTLSPPAGRGDFGRWGAAARSLLPARGEKVAGRPDEGQQFLRQEGLDG